MAQRTSSASLLTAGTVRVMRMGMRGADVRRLQRALRARGASVRTDGVYGRSTRTAVRRVQKGLRLSATGVADGALLRRLGLLDRAPVGSSGVPAPPEPARASRSSFLKVFPVQTGTGTSYNYTDTWGAPRSQGAHQGTDVMAPRGAVLVAVADGQVDRLSRAETGLGGIWIWIRDTAGNTYYYAHLDTIASGLDAGDSVKAGQPIGTVGNTGDARHGSHHLHFEIHPGGGGAINPYQDLVRVDPARSGGTS